MGNPSFPMDLPFSDHRRLPMVINGWRLGKLRLPDRAARFIEQQRQITAINRDQRGVCARRYFCAGLRGDAGSVISS